GLNGREAGRLRVLSREEDHLGRRSDVAYRGGGGRPRAVRQAEVEKYDVGIQGNCRVSAFGDRADIPHDGHVALAVDQRGQALGDDAVVFDNEDASSFGIAVAPWILQG